MSLSDAQRNEVIALIGQYGANRRGLVVSYQPQPPMAKVLLQPENIETGWLPVLSPWVGPGWGIVAPLEPNDQVLLVCEDADGANYAIMGRYFSDVDQSPSTQPALGEFFMQSKAGAQLYFKADGSIQIVAGTVKITGNLEVTGEVYRGYGTGDQVSLGGHRHTQPNDTHGDAEQPTNAPTAGT